MELVNLSARATAERNKLISVLASLEAAFLDHVLPRHADVFGPATPERLAELKRQLRW